MYLFRRLALLLACSLPVMPVVLAQSSNSSPSNPAGDSAQSSSSSSQSTQASQSAAENQGQVTVQQRIRLRRDQRRATAIHDAFDHRWESYMDMGYLRIVPGPNAQRVTEYAWQGGLTRFSSERLGYTLDLRGCYGTAFVGLNFADITRPAISQYDALVGPVYRFYMQPKYAISGRVMAGPAYGNFTGDTNGFGSICKTAGSCLLYPSGFSFAASASVIGEYNLTPNIGFKLAPEYFFTGFGSTIQASRGFTTGIVYRFGKQ
jgi:hypothetical protein